MGTQYTVHRVHMWWYHYIFWLFFVIQKSLCVGYSHLDRLRYVFVAWALDDFKFSQRFSFSFFISLFLLHHRFVFVFLPLPSVCSIYRITKFTLNRTAAQRMKMRFMCLLSVSQPTNQPFVYILNIEAAAPALGATIETETETKLKQKINLLEFRL